MKRAPLCLMLSIMCHTASASLWSEPSGPWETIDRPYYRLHHRPQRVDDANKVDSFLQHAVAEMKSEFAAHHADRLMRAVDCGIYLYAKPNEHAADGRSLVVAGEKDGILFAGIHFLTPSAYRPGSRNNVGEPKDDRHYLKGVVHEYASVVLGAMARRKEKGWKFFRGPDWFVQGYEEYLALMHSSKHSREVTFRKYLDLVNRDPQRIGFDFGVEARDPYIDGAVLLLYMHETYGKQNVHRILMSPKGTFGKAIGDALAVDLPTFASEFEKWRDEKARAASQSLQEAAASPVP